ncbi:SPOR domain-containing protein [Rubrivirga sp. S365]|uniref:SPOR domain-containing protein n=1 Tax=Rubrivirga litoralis TaxID=3075598 RepID=A0ABU3BUF2_9BACT|nr:MULTISPECIES: SPOR domain-containing protein [unclassified Rubrivirga]MDT0632922.1 SPOR domain-containing protein [Rubrivirga sp. F394]MDT7857470.1 SPOR domain-containing protein [Rubrivirga sp. S365]
MTPIDALAAALRERLVTGRPAPLPGLGTLVRQHVSARVEEHADGSRTILPPGETIGLAGADETAEPIAAAFARALGLPPGDAEGALADAVDQVEARLATTGEARLHGIGLLRRTSRGVVLGVESSLLDAVNQAYDGLAPIEARPAGGAVAEPAPPHDDAGDASDSEADAAPPDASPFDWGEDPPAAEWDDDEPAPEEEDADEDEDFSTLDLDDLLPHPPDAAPAAAPPGLGWGSLAPPEDAPPADEAADDALGDDALGHGMTEADEADADQDAAPPRTPEAAEDEAAGDEADDETLAVPFGVPEGESLADVLPPTPPEHDPALDADAAPDDLGGAADPGGAGHDDNAPTPAAWASLGTAAAAPLSDDPAPLSSAAAPSSDEGGAEPVPTAETASEPPATPPTETDAAPTEASAPERPRRVPVDRVGPPAKPPGAAGPAVAPPVEALRGGAGRPTAAAPPERSFPWWIVAAVVLLGVAALAWWATSRGPDAPPTAATDVAQAEPTVVSAAPPASRAAPRRDNAQGVPGNAAAPAPDDDADSAVDPAPPAAAAPGGQPPRVPGGAAPARPPARSIPAVNVAPPQLGGLDADDRAALTGGTVDPDDRDTWTFVVVSLQIRDDADAIRRGYQEAGYKTALLAPPSGSEFHRVAVGQFRSRSQALRLRDRLPPQAPPETWALSLRTL